MLYTQALSAGSNDQDKASALKNLAYAQFKLGNIENRINKVR